MVRNRVSHVNTCAILRNIISEARILGFYNKNMEAKKMRVDVDFLRRLRRQRHLSLGQAAKLLGKSRSTLWRYENCRVNMPVRALLELAEFYGVSVDQLTTTKDLP